MERPLLKLFNLPLGSEFLEAYEKWLHTTAIDDIDYVDFRLVSKVYESARALGTQRNARLENILKYWWLKCNLIDSFLKDLDDALVSSELQFAILLKGAAIYQNYAKPYHRAMGDVDILIEFTDLTILDRILHNLGCRPRISAVHIPLETLNQDQAYSKIFHKTIVYTYKDIEVDIHWNLPALMCTAHKKRLIKESLPTSFLFFRRPNYAFQIAMLVIHGQHKTTLLTNLNWVNDLALLLHLAEIQEIEEAVKLVREDDRVSHVYNLLLFAQPYIASDRLTLFINLIQSLGLKPIKPSCTPHDFAIRSRYFLLKTTQTRLGNPGDRSSAYYAYLFVRNKWQNFIAQQKSLYTLKKFSLNTLGALMYVVKSKKTNYDYFV